MKRTCNVSYFLKKYFHARKHSLTYTHAHIQKLEDGEMISKPFIHDYQRKNKQKQNQSKALIFKTLKTITT